MKRIMIAAVLIIILLQLHVNAGVVCQASSQGNETPDYKLEAISISGESLQLLQITLVEDCYVTIKVMDSDQTKLADGEMETGTYNVYYKSSDGISDRPVKCVMEIYLDQSKSEILYRRDIVLPVN